MAMQKFADHITGHRPNGKLTLDVLSAHFDVGHIVRVSDGPFATHKGEIDRVDIPRGRYIVLVNTFDHTTPIELEEKQLKYI